MSLSFLRDPDTQKSTERWHRLGKPFSKVKVRLIEPPEDWGDVFMSTLRKLMEKLPTKKRRRLNEAIAVGNWNSIDKDYLIRIYRSMLLKSRLVTGLKFRRGDGSWEELPRKEIADLLREEGELALKIANGPIAKILEDRDDGDLDEALEDFEDFDEDDDHEDDEDDGDPATGNSVAGSAAAGGGGA